MAHAIAGIKLLWIIQDSMLAAEKSPATVFLKLAIILRIIVPFFELAKNDTNLLAIVIVACATLTIILDCPLLPCHRPFTFRGE